MPMPTPRIVPGTLKLTEWSCNTRLVYCSRSKLNPLALVAVATAGPSYMDHPC